MAFDPGLNVKAKKIFYFLIIDHLNFELHLILFFQHFQVHRSPLHSPKKYKQVLFLVVFHYWNYQTIMDHVHTIIKDSVFCL